MTTRREMGYLENLATEVVKVGCGVFVLVAGAVVGYWAALYDILGLLVLILILIGLLVIMVIRRVLFGRHDRDAPR